MLVNAPEGSKGPFIRRSEREELHPAGEAESLEAEPSPARVKGGQNQGISRHCGGTA